MQKQATATFWAELKNTAYKSNLKLPNSMVCLQFHDDNTHNSHGSQLQLQLSSAEPISTGELWPWLPKERRRQQQKTPCCFGCGYQLWHAHYALVVSTSSENFHLLPRILLQHRANILLFGGKICSIFELFPS